MINIDEFLKTSSYNTWKEPKHIKLIKNTLLKLEKRIIKNLIVNIPPRHGKSELISKYFPVWYLLNNPNHRIILTTYNNSFASLLGGQCLEIINEFGADYGFHISINNKGKGHFKLDGYKGSITAVGAGGSITGRGADLIIIDDPIKNIFEAKSEIRRENLWDWLTTTAFTRLEPNGIIIIVMTRWHKDDLCGKIIKRFEIENILNEIIKLD